MSERIWIKKAIKVKTVGATNTKPARFIVTCEDKRRVYSVGINGDEQKAAEQFIEDYGLDWQLANAGRIDTDTVFFTLK